ncbi:aminomethyltransferase [Dictyostelium purpureum]|uniref:Aminomethyltransferase n=1 Tax=Dictyostelium purpureum TaxID=5786 RepID=F1A4B3_DICPU|nr:aminomethyltransferase [Dictyostelium purpureum]EGC28969.1 aminomethyltransferase [Dictyostelium purpureum]|eukprot:XP_003294508.1 aminomethyltransferase [Dictyostelium purpureum]
MNTSGLFLKSLKASTRASNKCFFSSSTELKKTSLNQLHKELGGKMVPFCGWEMPVQYPAGVLKEHMHCRKESSLFDVSHMGQLRFHGKDRVKFFESIVVADLQSLAAGHSKLSVFTTENGGIIDDTMITNAGDSLYVVVNAGCADKDIAHINQQMKLFKEKGNDVSMELLEDLSLIAIQGPATEVILQKMVKQDITNMEFMTQRVMNIAGIDCIVTRCGYTGEDGFEISVPSNKAVQLAEILLSTSNANSEHGIKPAGLGARDSLRLEAGLCLYGHDLNDQISPIEASLNWLISKRRREEGGFPGASKIQQQLKDGVSQKRVGLIVEGSPAREGSLILDPSNNQEIGRVTSGTLSPVTRQAISMGYVSTPLSKVGTKVNVSVRNKIIPATISKMPFVPTHYKKI